MIDKRNETQELIKGTQKEIANTKVDTDKINAKTTTYQEMIDKLNRINAELTEKYQRKDAIPNLLNQIMYVIPKTVQITSIENTVGKHIVIKAQAVQYEQLGYFKAKLKLDGILDKVESDSGVKERDIVKITIEGELP